MPRREPLPVWLDGVQVATFSSRRGHDIGCHYIEAVLERYRSNTPLLSCSLPLSPRRLDATVFASGLLPEGQHLQAMAALAKVASNDVHALLGHFGRDVAGAPIIGNGPESRSGEAIPYDEAELAAEVANLPQRPLALYDDSQLSIAGLQNKLLLVSIGPGNWGRPTHGLASTHLLKVEDRRFPGLSRAEAECLQLARVLGLTPSEAIVETLAGIDCLIVSRFDRVVETNGRVRRVHQEDLCQATGRDPQSNDGRGKYQRYGGPWLVDLAMLLERYAANPPAEHERLAAMVAFTALIGNADAHGKNVALLHPEPGTVELAPVYDTVPTVAWPGLPRRAAMTVGGEDDIDRIDLDAIEREAATWRFSRATARRVASETVAKALAAIDRGVIDGGGRVAQLVRARAARFV